MLAFEQSLGGAPILFKLRTLGAVGRNLLVSEALHITPIQTLQVQLGGNPRGLLITQCSFTLHSECGTAFPRLQASTSDNVWSPRRPAAIYRVCNGKRTLVRLSRVREVAFLGHDFFIRGS